MAVKRIEMLGVPVDILRPEDLEMELMEIMSRPGTKQILFLSVWDLLKARGKNTFAQCVRNADLVLPVSKSIIKGARFLGLDVPVRYNPFTTVISILTVLENHYKTFYMLGGRKRALMQAEKNVHATFPRLQFVGRYVGYYPKAVEDDVVQAIYKASPSLVLVSDGLKEKNCWAYNRRNRFSSSIFLYYKNAVGIFSERIRRVSDKTFEKGNEIWYEIFRNPAKIFLIFPYISYLIQLLWFRLFKSKE